MSIHIVSIYTILPTNCNTAILKKVKKFRGLRPQSFFELLNALYTTANKC